MKLKHKAFRRKNKKGVDKMRGGYFTKLALSGLLAAVMVIAFSGIASAEMAKLDSDALGRQVLEIIQVNPELLEQVEVDVDGDDSQLGDQPGDFNDGFGPNEPEITDGGIDEGSNTQDIPDGGIDEGSNTQDIPDGGDEQTTDEQEDEEEDETDREELPFTGGNQMFFWLLGVGVIVVGASTIAGYKVIASRNK